VTLRAAVCLIAIASALTPLNGLTTPATTVSQRTQRLMLRTEDGLSIAATWHEPAYRPAPAVVLVHMLTRSRRDWEGVALRLASEGIGSLTIDLRGHGDSSGSAGDLAAMEHDVNAAKRHLAVRPDVIHSRIGIAGASLGASLAVLAAADDPLVKSLVLLSPSLDYRGLRIEAALRKYGKRPALLIAGKDDGYAVRTVSDLGKGGGGIREVLLLDSAGHGTTMLQRVPELGPQIAGWFRRTLQ
jgi:alpha-beta hydrolase superfamily lysophospholipase